MAISSESQLPANNLLKIAATAHEPTSVYLS
jgi:hypothetical protein